MFWKQFAKWYSKLYHFFKMETCSCREQGLCPHGFRRFPRTPLAFAVAPKGQLKPSGLISSVGKAQIARAKRVKSRVACHFFRNEKSYALDLTLASAMP